MTKTRAEINLLKKQIATFTYSIPEIAAHIAACRRDGFTHPALEAWLADALETDARKRTRLAELQQPAVPPQELSPEVRAEWRRVAEQINDGGVTAVGSAVLDAALKEPI